MIIFIFGFALGHLFQTFQTVPDTVRESIRPIFASQELESRVQVETLYETNVEELQELTENEPYDPETIREQNLEEAIISRQGSNLVTASFNPEEVFGIRLFEKKTCKCGGRNIFPIKEMPEIFNSSQIAQLEKNRQEFFSIKTGAAETHKNPRKSSFLNFQF